MHPRLAVGSSVIVLIIAALLASGAGLGALPWNEAYAAASTPPATGERSVERVRRAPPSERNGVRRTAFIRATAPAILRVQASSGAAGNDSPRSAAEPGADSSLLELVTRRATGGNPDVSRSYVPRPEQPAPSSRAPPTV